MTFLHGPFNFKVNAGECVCISGASGAGKTVLLRAIADLDPYQGDVFVDDTLCASISANAWRKRVGYITAESVWWHDTVAPHFHNLPQEWLTQLALDATILQRHIAKCSTGERQRLALLRVLQNRPEVLLLDEPTASLDDENSKRVEALLNQYKTTQQAALLWISHSIQQQQRVSNRVMLLQHQQLAEICA